MTCSLGNMRGCICILARSRRVRFYIHIFFIFFFHQKQQLFVFSFLMDREIYHTLYVSFTIIIMCSLCITSITNINARLSAGKGTRQVFALVCMCVAVVSVKYVRFAYHACKESQQDSIRGFARRIGGEFDITLHDERGEKCTLFRYNKYRGL